MAIFKGAAVAIVTPFLDNGEINYPKLSEFLDYQIENGTDAIVICGTTGESSTLSHEEHLEADSLHRRACEETRAGYRRNRFPIVRRPPFICPGGRKIRLRTHAGGDSLL